MPTLHIEHAITDFNVWAGAYARFEDARRAAGVRAANVRRPIDDPNFVVIDLDFDSREEASAFLRVLETVVWQDPSNSPALLGSPRAVVLEPAPGASASP